MTDHDRDDDAEQESLGKLARKHRSHHKAEPTLLIQDGDLTVTMHSDGDAHHGIVDVEGGGTARVEVAPEDNIWRATLGDVTRTGSHPDTAVTMCVWAAQEEGTLPRKPDGKAKDD